MKIDDIMTAPVHSCLPTDSLHTAAEIMWQDDCGCVPVVDEERRVLGIVTDRDICMTAHLTGQPLRQQAVGSVMCTDVVSCDPEDNLQDAALLMAEKQLRRLPVVDAAGRLVGIVSLNDLALACQRAAALEFGAGALAHTLAAICQHRANIGSAEPR